MMSRLHGWLAGRSAGREAIEEAPSDEPPQSPLALAGREPEDPPDGCGGPRAYAERRRDAASWDMATDMDAVARRPPPCPPMAMTLSWPIPRRSRTSNRPCPAYGHGRSFLAEAFPRAAINAALRQAFTIVAGFPMIRMAIQVVSIDDATDRRDVHEIIGISTRDRLCPERTSDCRWPKPRKSLPAFNGFLPTFRSQSGKRISAPAPAVAIGAR